MSYSDLNVKCIKLTQSEHKSNTDNTYTILSYKTKKRMKLFYLIQTISAAAVHPYVAMKVQFENYFPNQKTAETEEMIEYEQAVHSDNHHQQLLLIEMALREANAKITKHQQQKWRRRRFGRYHKQ